jgi:hypothetical protein
MPTNSSPVIIPTTVEEVHKDLVAALEDAPAEPTAVRDAPAADPTKLPPEAVDAIRAEYGEAGVVAAREEWQQRQTAQTAHQEHLAGEHSKLSEAIPGWNDPVTRAEIQQQLRNYAVSQGYTEEDIRRVDDSRAVILAYHALQRGKELAAPRPVAPPARRERRDGKADVELREAVTRFERTHRQRDAAKILEGLF